MPAEERGAAAGLVDESALGTPEIKIDVTWDFPGVESGRRRGVFFVVGFCCASCSKQRERERESVARETFANFCERLYICERQKRHTL